MKGRLIKKLALQLLAMGLSATMSVPTFAGVSLNTIDPVAVVTDDGRQIVVTGPIACSAAERVILQVTVTQRTTGAIAQGRTRFICTGDVQQWEVWVKKVGNAVFTEGAASAIALARTTANGQATDAHQWLVNVTLAQ